MDFFPPLALGWLNGWIPIALFYSIFFVLLRTFPKETVDRLYDDTGWVLAQARPARFGAPFDLAVLLLLPFNSLQTGEPVFWAGLLLYIIGFSGFVFSLHSFNITPRGVPVTKGLYRISRNPQWVSLALILLGTSLMVGSWTILLLLSVRILLNHFRILGEEQALEDQYGESYQAYKSQVPRYLLFF